MKYALVTHGQKKEGMKGEQLILNAGDYMQWVAIANLYEYMNLEKKDIVELSIEDLCTYKGEKIILPVNYMWADSYLCPYVTENHVTFSDDIVPVFLGVSFKKGNWEWTKEWIGYFKKYEPIGCRDYATWEKLSELGIAAYLAGCITVTLPLSNRVGGDTAYFVEAPKGLEKHVPEKLKKKNKFIKHQVIVTEDVFYGREGGLEWAKDILDEYIKNASMVITSRLHCALPCMAVGIPVILAKEYFAYPFDLQRKFLPFYSYKDFGNIDWEPQKVDIEQYKKVALECARKRLLGENAEDEMAKLHAEYSFLYKGGYVEEKMEMEVFVNKIKKLYKENDSFNYALWGISDNAEWIYNYIKTNYPQAKLVKVIDNLRPLEFHGIIAEKAETLSKKDDFLVIATTINVSVDAIPFFRRIGKNTDQYICVTDGIMVHT